MTQSQIRLDNRMSLQLNSEATNLRITKLKLEDAGTNTNHPETVFGVLLKKKWNIGDFGKYHTFSSFLESVP